MFKTITKFIVVASAALIAVAPIAQSHAANPIKLGYAKCAHCTPLSLVPENAEDGAKIEAISFNTGNDVLTALMAKSIDVAQLTYLHYAIALDRGFDVVAISGQINGGSQILVGNDLPVEPGNWAGLKALIAQYKSDKKPFRVAASRGNAQDIHMRGAFAKHGIDINKDVQFVNIPNPSDHVQALRRGEVELITSVDPFASQIRNLKAAKFFDYPYDQAAGKLTNLILTRSDVIASNPEGVASIVRAIVKVNGMMMQDKALFAQTIHKVTGLDLTIAADAVGNLYPDYAIHRKEALAVASMMRDLKYIGSDVSAKVEQHLDYRFLEQATGKSKNELGY